MRSSSTSNNDNRKIINCLPVDKNQDKNNNHGNVDRWPNNNVITFENEGKRNDDQRNKINRSLSTTIIPKPAPRTRVPSASVVPTPALAHHDTYENLQRLLNGDDNINRTKVCNDGLRLS